MGSFGFVALLAPSGRLTLTGAGKITSWSSAVVPSPDRLQVWSSGTSSSFVDDSADGGRWADFRVSEVVAGERVPGGIGVTTRACASRWTAMALARVDQPPAMDMVLAPRAEVTEDQASQELRLVRVPAEEMGYDPDAGTPTVCQAVDRRAPDSTWRLPGRGGRDGGAQQVALLPDGERTVLRFTRLLDGGFDDGGRAMGDEVLGFVGAGGTNGELRLAAGEDHAFHHAMGADRRVCTSTFKPALYVALREGVVAFPMRSQDCSAGWLPTGAGTEGARCQGGAQQPGSALALFCASFLPDVAALAPSPNGRRLLLVVDRGHERRLVELDVDRDPEGNVRSLGLARDTAIGRLSPLAPDPAGLSFSLDGRSAQVTVPGNASRVVYE